jgi:hypothetical protein
MLVRGKARRATGHGLGLFLIYRKLGPRLDGLTQNSGLRPTHRHGCRAVLPIAMYTLCSYMLRIQNHGIPTNQDAGGTDTDKQDNLGDGLALYNPTFVCPPH